MNWLCLAFVVALIAPWQAQAQVLYGSIVGTVEDATGGVVPGATVSITNPATGETRDAETTESGSFTLSNLAEGKWDLTVNAQGFRNYVAKGITVSANRVGRYDLTLQVGQVTESVTVSSEALTLQTEKTDVNTELTQSEVQDLPLARYKNYQSLLQLVPGATPPQFQNAVTDTPARALTTNINGTNRNNNATRVDGAADVYVWLPHHTVYVPPSETIESVNISTNNFDAEQGMAGGAAISVSTKSGTNQLHGSLFEFHQNSAVGAKDFFFKDEKTPKSLVNIFGYTVGGPIVKNKLFFFNGWEGNRERINRNNLFTVPTDQQRAGDFSGLGATIYDPQSGNPDGTGRTPFANNMIPSNRFSQPALALQDLVPEPNQPGVANNYFNSATQELNRDNFDTKIDWNRTASHHIWGKYSAMDAQVTGQFALGAAGGPCLCDGGNGTGDTLVQVAALGQTWTFSPTFVMDTVLGFTRMGQHVEGPDFGTNYGTDVLGIAGTNGPDIRQSGLPIFDIDGYTTFGNPDTWTPMYRNDQSYTLSHNFSWLRGAHDIRFGFDGIRHQLNHWQPEIGGGPRGQFTFNQGVTGLLGQSTTQFNSYAAFLLGAPQSLAKSVQFEKMTAFEYQFAGYIRDRWQMTPKLTLTLGLRYENYPLMTRAGRGGIEDYDPTTNTVLLGGLGGNDKHLGQSSSDKLFAPRLGVAYRLTDSTVIRTGYGITYDPMVLARPLRGFYPLTIAQSFDSANSFQAFNSLLQGIPDIPLPDVSSGSLPLPPGVQMRWIAGDELHRGYVQSWNFIIERKLPWQTIASVGYVGTQSTRQLADLNINAAEPGTGSAGRPYFQQYGTTADLLSWNGYLSGNYHSLQATLNRRAAEGLTLKLAYTYSKATDFTDDDGWAGVDWNIPSQFPRNRARAGYDITHNFSMGFVYDLPFGPGKALATGGLQSRILSGWQVNGILTAVGGRPFTVTASDASLNAPGNSQTADQVLADVGRSPDNPDQFFSTAAFAPISDVRFGTSGRNIIDGPGILNLDMSLFRDFRITERFKAQFRAEAFNLTNSPHFDLPNANVNDAAFGTVSSTNINAPNRNIRFALRLQF
jgi:Carboxypeptidase regulatory-like domain/TonB dependent receptor-like, beta-barrel